MKTPHLLVAVAAALLFAGCTSIPSRFTQDPAMRKGLGYCIENETEAGFTLEIVVMRYSYAPNPDRVIQEGRELFVQVAKTLAKRRYKTIEPISKADLQVTANRNLTDARYLTFVIGRVVYSKSL